MATDKRTRSNTQYWMLKVLIVQCKYYSTAFPRFQFSKEQIQDGKAYYRLCVLPNNRLPFVCPNPSSYLNDIQDQILVDKLYENIWYVDKESFQACKVGSPKAKGINQKWLNCNNPSVLKYDSVVFAPFSASSDLSFPPGTEHYFIGKYSVL